MSRFLIPALLLAVPLAVVCIYGAWDAGKGASRPAGVYPAASRIKDDKAPGGFGCCDNYPLDLGQRAWGADGVVALVAFPDEPVAGSKHQGFVLRLINRTGKTVPFEACDSRLYIVQEALDETGRWREIEEPPCAICGNSLHRVFLESGQFWEFAARLYDGSVETKLRFRLDPDGERGEAVSVYSNEFTGKVAKGQFRLAPTTAEARRALCSNRAAEDGVLATLIGLLDEDAGWGEIGPDRAPQREAALRLAEFGPAASEALPALRAVMKGRNRSLRGTAAYAVWKISGSVDEAVEVLVAVLGASDEHRSHSEAALWLSRIGPPAKEAVPALCRVLKKGDEDARAKVAEALAAIRERPDVAVPALIAALGDEKWLVRCYAGHALQAFGADAKAAIPALRDALRDKEGLVATSAAEALWAIERRPEAVVPTLVETLKSSPEPYARSAAAEALGNIGPAAKDAVLQLTAGLDDEWRTVRVSAAGALWKVTRQSEPAVGTLIRALDRDWSLDESDTGRAVRILGEMGREAGAALPALRAALKRSSDRDAWAREGVENVIRKIESEIK
jgi:HEAT repeat protein